MKVTGVTLVKSVAKVWVVLEPFVINVMNWLAHACS